MAENDITKILTALGRIEEKVSGICQTTTDHETRLRTLEGRGGKKWDTVVFTVLSSLVTLAIGYIVGTI